MDAILAKRNVGTRKGMASAVIGVGPGFTAGKDVNAVVETNRGHLLGKVIWEGGTQADTGKPGEVLGFSEERVIRAPADGHVESMKELGEMVDKGELIGRIGETGIFAGISGMLRGMINQDVRVYRDMKIGDIDPRGAEAYYNIVSDKARAIGGGVLEAILHLFSLFEI